MKQAYEELKDELKNAINSSVVVAVSGGVDSISLLHLMIRLKSELQLKVICAHVNHNVRKESDNEKIFVEDFCAQNDIIFEYMKIKNYNDDNFHNQARNIRYNFFNEIVHKYNSKYLLTAHHADDLVETILMRLVRGASMKGYSGFSKKVVKSDYILFRPFININKDQIYEYVQQNNLKYVQDQSNFKDTYTRNRFRKYIVPLLKKEDSNIYNKFYKFSTTILEANEYIDNQVNKIKSQVIENNKIKIEKFVQLDHIIQMRLICLYLESIYGDNLMLITDKHVNLVYNLILSSKSNGIIYLPNNMKGIKSYNDFSINNFNDVDITYEIEITDYVSIPNNMNIEIVDKSDIDDNNICRLNYSSIVPPLYVRNRKNGDKMYVKGMESSKKVSEIFINSKINPSLRKTWPIVVDSKGNIVWIPGLRKSKFNSSKDEKCDIILRYY